MKIAKGNATVAGINFAIFADITKRGMIAVNEATGEEKIIIRSGYATKDLTIRKAVANAFSPKKHRDKFHPTFFDVDHGYDRPLYFLLLKDQYELRPDGTGGISFFTIAEFRDCLDRIVEVQA